MKVMNHVPAKFFTERPDEDMYFFFLLHKKENQVSSPNIFYLPSVE